MHLHRSAAIVAVSGLFLGMVGLSPAAGRTAQQHGVVYREPIARAVQRGPIATGLRLVPDLAGDPGNRGPSGPGVASARRSSQSITRTRALLFDSAGPNVTGMPCGADEPPEAVCGTVAVPVDSANPALGTLPIAFDMRPRVDQADPAAGTLLVPNPVGNGLSASFALQGFWAIEHFLTVHDHWDILYVDDRGSGRSQPVSCPALQDFEGSRSELADAVAQCGHSLGPLASRLGAAYVAEDLNRVRTALGLGKIDLYGVWAAAITLDAYAVRYPQSLRSLTYEAPNVPNYRTDPWQRHLPGRLPASADATCASDPMCLESGLDSSVAITRLASSVAKHPVTGTGYDDGGNAFPVKVDEEGLIRILQDSTGYINQGEAGAAALAWLNHRDPVPLARMDAISDASYPRTPVLQAPPEVVDFGDTFARICSDYALPFNRFSSSVSQRRKQYDAAAKALPPDTFSPFSVSTWLKVADNTQYCVGWPAPKTWRAPVPAASHFPDVPMLSVASNAGTFTGPDLAGPFVRQYPRGRLVVQLMGDGGPINQCGDTFMEKWLIGLDDAELSCNDRGAWDATGAFAQKVAQETPIARPIADSGDQSTRRDRQIAVIAISALRDYLLHDERPPVEEGPGLRGGSWRFTGSTDTTWDIAYDQYRWTDDLTFSGSGHFAVVLSGTSSIPDLFQWSVDLRVADSSGSGGTLHLVTEHRFEHDARATVTGTLYGRSIAVTAPAL